MNKSTVKKLIALGSLLVVMAILLALKTNQAVCEFFATTFSRAWIFVFGHIFGVLPFSVYELFLVCAIVGAVVLLVFVIVDIAKRKWQQLVSLVLSVAIGVVSFVNIYTATASFSYNRNPLPEEIYQSYNSETFTYEEAVELAELMVDKLNCAYRNTEHDENGNVVFPFGFDELSNKLAEEYKRLDSEYFSPYTPKGKRIVNKWIMSQMHIVGVFFAPTGEANINGNENSMYLPVTLAHEMAHGKGVMTEYNADIVSLYVTLTSDDVYLTYGALQKTAFTALNMLWRYPTVKEKNQYPEEKYNELVAKMDAGIIVERQNYFAFFDQFTLLDDVGEFFNDIYLKLQNQGGTDSYTKPGLVIGTGQADDVGHEIMYVASFSGKENLLITLFKQGILQ